MLRNVLENQSLDDIATSSDPSDLVRELLDPPAGSDSPQRQTFIVRLSMPQTLNTPPTTPETQDSEVGDIVAQLSQGES